MKDYFKSLPGDTRNRLLEASKRLLELADSVTHTAPPGRGSLRVRTRLLDPEALLDEMSRQTCRGHPYLYYFQAVNHVDLAEVERTFLDTKKRERKRKEKNTRPYSGFNRQERPSEVLYVGRSYNIRQRLNQHLGYGSKGTYSLQLAHWASDLDLELDFVYAKYPKDIAPDILQAIEDTLWDKLRPMFGRRGQR